MIRESALLATWALACLVVLAILTFAMASGG